MGAEFEKLLEDFSFGNEFICSSDNIKCLSRFLPRPPIFSIPLEEDNLNLYGKNNQESLSWLRIHRCYLIISMAFGISNRLENLIGFFALWMAKSQEDISYNNSKTNQFTNNSSNDLSIILEKQLFIGHSENEIYTDLNIFQTLFSVVIGMQIRELLIKSIKNNDFELINKYKIKFEVLSFPFRNFSQKPKENELIWKSIKRNFPPLNELNRPNWYSFILSGAEEKFNLNELTELNKNNLQVFPSENYKFRLNNFEDILIMQYLSTEFPIVNLPPPIIQMRLELVPEEFCCCNRQTFTSKNLNKNTKNNILIEHFDEIGKFSLKINENNLIKEKEEKNICKIKEIDELEILAEEIRSGIKRLELLEEETNLINGKEMGNLPATGGINEINKSVKQQKNIRPKHQLKPNKKLSKINKNKRQSITQSDLEKKQKTYSAFLSFLLKQKGIEGSEELTTTTTEPLKSSSEINNNYYSTNNSVYSSESRSSLNSNKERRKNKKLNYSAKLNEEEESSTSNWASEEEEEEKNIFEKELTKEQLLQEMNKVGKHLEWIWAQIGGRINEENVNGEDYDNEEVDEGEDKEEGILERKDNSYDQELLENEEHFIENKKDKEEILQEPNEQKFSSEEEFSDKNLQIKQFKMPEIRIKSNVDFSIPSLIEEEKSYELRELEEIEDIGLNSNNISLKAEEIKQASGQLSSSSGYHHHHSSCSSSENLARKNDSLINKSFQNWSIPPNIQPMDFSRLDIDSDEERNSGGKTINKWTDIEVYPREILKEKTPLIINEKMQTKQKTTLKNKWRPPSWLRLLPPFDGTIRTERISCGKITAERQLLQLNLDRGHQRTFLDIAAKNRESLKRLKKKEKGEEIIKVSTNKEIKEEQSKQNFPEQSSIYDSGIALDQTANTSRYQQEFLLYSVELCEEEIEIMRQMAKQT
ncbi:unnamed protein product [Meloidogyne enterolobii]|uniref:Uncharacterized protein n=1 Tax=Meloidogyne enterolobii TaxID=390850 RepID=A0ACB0ZQQ8_MELEN